MRHAFVTCVSCNPTGKVGPNVKGCFVGTVEEARASGWLGNSTPKRTHVCSPCLEQMIREAATVGPVC